MLLFLVFYVWHILSSTGYFRQINSDKVKKEKHFNIPGAEDMEADYEEEFLIISSDDRAKRRDGDDYESGLYIFRPNNSDLKIRKLNKPIDSPPLYPHGISMYKLDSSNYRLLVVNHIPTNDDPLGSSPNTIHSIVEFEFDGNKLEFIKDHKHEMIQSPNDVVAINETDFYFTNDHGSKTALGKIAEDYLGLPKGNVVYYDGTSFSKVASGIAYANGINYDTDQNKLYVASPRGFSLYVYEVDKNTGELIQEEKIDCGTGVDNIEIDMNGTLWIGAHPNLLAFAAYADGKKDIAPTEIITIDYKGVGNYKVTSIYEDEGNYSSASTIAIPLGDHLYIGNVMAESFESIEMSELFPLDSED